MSARLGQRVEAGVEVEVAGLGPERLGEHAADAPLAGPAPPAHVDHDPPGQPAGQLPQARVRGAGEVGEEGERLVMVLVHEPLEGLLVELPHLRRDLRKPLVAP